MNWGKGILAVCIIFVIGVGVMVYISVNKNIDLVTKNYYEEEIKYQQQIDKINNSNNLKKQLIMQQNDGSLVIIFPDDEYRDIKGEISFYRPSDAKKDFKIPIILSGQNQQVIATNSLQKGLWKVQVNWNKSGVDYYNEEKLMVQ
jgi:hypothetical protein